MTLTLSILLAKIDSIGNLQAQIDYLYSQLKNVKCKQSFFHDNLTSQTGIFVMIVMILVGTVAAINWLVLFNPAKKALADIKRLKADIVEIKGSALRALYEAQTRPDWKIIHHIRYCEWFYDTKRVEGLIEELKKIENKELPDVKKPEHKENHHHLKNTFEHKEGLRIILKKISQSNDSEVKEIALRILAEITPDK